jgi:hypothetical protein
LGYVLAEWRGQRGSRLAQFVYVNISNHSTVNPKTAKNVWAHIEYSYLSEPPLGIRGRWANTDQPSTVGLFKSKQHLDFVDIVPGIPQPLDIAVKYQGDNHYYAFNNESYDEAATSGANPRLLIRTPSVLVRIQLQGDNARATFEYLLAAQRKRPYFDRHNQSFRRYPDYQASNSEFVQNYDS